MVCSPAFGCQPPVWVAGWGVSEVCGQRSGVVPVGSGLTCELLACAGSRQEVVHHPQRGAMVVCDRHASTILDELGASRAGARGVER